MTMRALLLLCLLAVTLASEEFDYKPDPVVGRVRRSYIVREYEYYDEDEDNDVAPEVIHEEVVEPLPTDEQCKGRCNYYQPQGRRYTREDVSPENDQLKDTRTVANRPLNLKQPIIETEKDDQSTQYFQQPIQNQNAEPNKISSNQPTYQRTLEPLNQASTLQQQIIRDRKIQQNNFAAHQPIASNQPTYQNRIVQPSYQPNQLSYNHQIPQQLLHTINQPMYLARVNAPNHAPTYQPISYPQASQFATLHPDPSAQVSQFATLHPAQTAQASQFATLHPAQTAQASQFAPLHPATSAQVSSPVFSPLLRAPNSDQASAAGHHHPHKHSQSNSQGGGRSAHARFHKQGGEKSTESFNKDHHVDKGGKGEKVEEVHKKQYEEAGGKKKKHHDHAGHQGNHEEEAHGHRGAKFDEKKGHKKGHKTKGYHNKYHKDEFHKEHKFYDDYHKSGEHHRFGKFNAKHASNESGKKKAHHVDAGHDYVEKGRKGYSNKGHVDADHKGYNGKRGHDEHHKHESSRGKKGGKEGGAQWAYAKKQ